MGTNFYLQSRIPRQVYDRYHVAKTSWGWRPLFQENPETDERCYEDYDEQLEISSVADFKAAYDTGNYAIVDEYGEEYAWEEFESRVLQWCPDGKVHEGSYDYPVHIDENGYEFMADEFC